MRRAVLSVLVLALGGCQSNAPKPGDAPKSAGPVSKAPATEAPATDAPASAASAAPATQAVERVPPLAIKGALAGEQLDKADVLAADIEGGTMRRLTTRSPEYGPLFLHLAAQHPKAEVVAEALEGMARTWRRNGRGKHPEINDDYRAVALGRLDAKSDLVRDGAFTAVRSLLAADPPHPAALDKVLQILQAGSPAERARAIEVVISVREFQIPKPAEGGAKARIIDALLANLDSKSPFVVAGALDKLSRGAFPQVTRREALKAAAEARIADAAPGIRGPAALLLARLSTPAEAAEAAKKILPGLTHEDAYVRAASAEALGILKYAPAAHGIVALVEDKADVVLRLGGFTGLDGKAGTVEFLLSGGRTVDAVALNALRQVTRKGFDFKGGVTQTSRDEVAAAAKRWYAANKGKIPAP